MVKIVWTNVPPPPPQFLGIRHAMRFPAGKSLVAQSGEPITTWKFTLMK